jgi:hypothetical protein
LLLIVAVLLIDHAQILHKLAAAVLVVILEGSTAKESPGSDRQYEKHNLPLRHRRPRYIPAINGCLRDLNTAPFRHAYCAVAKYTEGVADA